MATTFKNATGILTTSSQDIYTVPASTRAIIIGCHVANYAASAATLTMSVHDSSAAADRSVANATSVPVNSAYEPIGKMVLETGDKIKAQASANTALSIVVSVLEIS
jgi:hypothetical protein